MNPAGTHFFEKSQVLMAVTSEDGRIHEANPAWRNLLGYLAEELENRNLAEFLHPDDQEIWKRNRASLLSDTPVLPLEFRIRDRHNEYHLVQWTETWSPEEQRFLGIGKDLAHRNQVQLNHKRIHALADRMPAMVALADPQGGLLYLNAAGRKLFGLPEEDRAPGPCLHGENLFHGHFPPWAEELLSRTAFPEAAQSGVWTGNLTCLTPSGREIPLRLNLIGHRDTQGNIEYFSAIGRDLSDEQENLRLFEELRNHLLHSAKLASLGQMAGGIAHEINNPVTVIHGFAINLKTMAERGQFDPQRVIRTTERIIETSERIARIASTMRALARSGQHESRELAAVGRLVCDTLELCKERFRIHNVELTIEEISPDLYIQCAPTEISQAILNLLNNAFDAVQGGTEPWVKIAIEEARQEAREIVRIRVTDSGVTIPEEVFRKMSNPFFTTKPAGKGTGMGLSIIRRIAETHGGDLQVDRACPNTCFVLTLPKLQQESEQKEAA